MGACPYTWFKTLVKSDSAVRADKKHATELRVTVSRNGETTVDVTLPAKSARWLLEVIPEEVIKKIRAEGIPIDAIQENLAQASELTIQPIFTLSDSVRLVKVWLE